MAGKRKKKQVTVDALEAAREAVRAKIKKAVGRQIVADPRLAASQVREVIPTGIPVVDHYVLGVGGLPVGRVSEWYSDEGGGKSSLALAAIAACQRIGTGLVALADDEQAYNTERCKVFGVDEGRLELIEPESTEESLAAQLAFLEGLPDGVGPNLLVWDSVAASVPEAEMGDKDARAALARAMSAPVKQIRALLHAKRTHWLVVNQVRQRMGVVYGDATTTPGGKQLKFAASHRVQLFPGKTLKDRTGQHVGRTITLMAAKNRFAPGYRKAKVRLMFAAGWDTEWCVVQHAKERGVLGPQAKVADGLEKALAIFTEKGWDYVPPKAQKDQAAPAQDDVEEEPDDGLDA